MGRVVGSLGHGRSPVDSRLPVGPSRGRARRLLARHRAWEQGRNPRYPAVGPSTN
ncbi:hypothetical protein ppKF707_2478 [Metapseudomonas furukawaii]|uniref:Uncharacterized protein n=1 Tax=Metapseudomonas furukawaii TaxID=1149133 RepID=A0AAD1C3Q9_METFU|nr:hypothetical protein ppKF707_2478 [Pseudomonas furukawaii]BAU75543.1 hypothetical protein KF707C_38550 [Pseudomonas furukawaii]